MIDQHATAAGLLQAIDGADQRRFAGTAAADNAENLPVLNRQVDTLEGIHRSLATFIGFAHADKTHMGLAQFRVQLGVGRARLRLIEPLASNSHVHVQLSQPG